MMKPLTAQEQTKNDVLENLVASKNSYLQLFYDIIEFEQKYLQLDQKDYIPAKNKLENIISNCTEVAKKAVEDKPIMIETLKQTHEKIQEQIWTNERLKPEGQNYLLPVGFSKTADCDTSATIEMIALGQAGFDCEMVMIQGHAILKVNVENKQIYMETVSPNKGNYTYYNSSKEVEAIYGRIYSEIKVNETGKFFSNILVNIALDYSENGDYQKSIKKSDEANKHYQRSIEKFDEAIKLWPQNFYAHHQKAKQTAKYNDIYRLNDQLKEMKKIALNSPETHEIESVFNFAQEKHDDAFIAIKKAVDYYMKLKPNPRQALAPTANAIFSTTIVILEKLIETMPDERIKNKYSQADAYFLLGKIYYKICQWERAAQAFADAKLIDPKLEKIDSYFMMAKNKGSVPSHMDYNHAIKLYSMAIDVEPDYAEHWEKRAEYNYEYAIRASVNDRGRIEDAISDYKIAYLLEDKDEKIDVCQKLLKLLIMVGRLDEAIDYISKELKNDEENEELRMRRALLYQICAHFESKNEYYKNAQKDYAYLIKNELFDPPPEEIVRFLHLISKSKGIENLSLQKQNEAIPLLEDLIQEVNNKLAYEVTSSEYSLMGLWYNYQMAIAFESNKRPSALSYIGYAKEHLTQIKMSSLIENKTADTIYEKLMQTEKRIEEKNKIGYK